MRYFLKNRVPCIFDICHCGKCNEIVYGGKRYIKYHHLVGNCNALGMIHTEEQKNKWSIQRRGENHPLYKIGHTSETKEKIKLARSKQDPTFLRHKHTEETKIKIREARKKQRIPNKFTKPELKFLEICNKHNLPYKYTGDGSFWIGNVNPDFVNCNGKKICVEVWGDYWHNLPKEIEKDARRLKTLEEFGWKRISVCQSEIYNLSEEEIIRKINEVYTCRESLS